VKEPEATEPSTGRKQPRGNLYVILALLIAVNVWIWVAQPTWIMGESGGITTLEVAEGLLRFRMYVQAQRIHALERQHHRLPETLAETGEPVEGIRYVRTGDGEWELIGELRRAHLTLSSTTPMADFLQPGES
jgi:hypothetical protein